MVGINRGYDDPIQVSRSKSRQRIDFGLIDPEGFPPFIRAPFRFLQWR